MRWWATDSAVVDQAQAPSPELQRRACHRLGVILDPYTVYIDLWLCDLEGTILANGKPDAYGLIGQSVADALWFKRARGLASGSEFAVADVCTEALFDGAQVAAYATSVRRGGDGDGDLIGVLGIHFNWQPQVKAVVEGVRLADDEKEKTRVLLIDAQDLVIAASDVGSIPEASLRDTISMPTGG